jgi:hypothetical protein
MIISKHKNFHFYLYPALTAVMNNVCTAEASIYKAKTATANEGEK